MIPAIVIPLYALAGLFIGRRWFLRKTRDGSWSSSPGRIPTGG